MSKLFFLVIALLLFGSCKDNSKKQNTITINKFHNTELRNIGLLDSLNYTDYYIESKWKIYLKYCDKKIVNHSNNDVLEKDIYFGELPIYLTFISIESDSLLHLCFEPILSDSHIIDYTYFEDSTLKYNFNKYLYYNIKYKSFYGYSVGSGIRIDSTEIMNYCNQTPNCNKKKFIEEHIATLNPWFIEEARKRKFID